MGLLDDAIREHLELRRRHGADPVEVAREERDALAPVPRDEATEPRESVVDDDGRMPSGEERVADSGTATGEASGSQATSMLQETAEIDMHAILDGAPGGSSSLSASGRGRAAPVAAQVERSTCATDVDDDPLAWEAPAPRVHRRERYAGAGRVFGGELPAEASAP